MVAIVSGNSLGLGQTSLATLGQHGQVGMPQHGRNGQAAFVNVATGNLVVQNQDDYVAGVGADIANVRTYNSRGQTSDADNWVMSLARAPLELQGTLNTAGSTIRRTAGDGAVATYTFHSLALGYVTTEGEGAHDTIVFAGGRYTWTDGSTRATEVYDGGSMRLLASLDAADKGFRYQYDAQGRLASVSAENGERTVYDYDTAGDLRQVHTESAAGAVTGTRVRYAYDSAHRLVKVTVDLSPDDNAVTDGKVYVTEYGYDGASKRVASIVQADGSKLAFSYVQVGAEFRLASATDALGQVTRFTYAGTRTTVTDALLRETHYDLDAAGQLARIIPPAGGPGMRFSYDGEGNVLSVTNGAGAATSFGYDARGNRILETDATGATLQRTFNASNQVLTETLQGANPLTTRYVYDVSGEMLRFTISAQGRVTENVYNAAGQRTASVVYGAKLYTATGATEAVLTAWTTLHGAAGIQRTDMAYDARGELASRTADGAVESFIHDPAGRLLQYIAAGGATTCYTYDGLGRVLTATDALGRQTVTLYQDAEASTRVTLANGLVSAQAYDRAGRLVAVTSAPGTEALGTTRHWYDANGRLRMTQDPTGVRNWTLYDDAGRKVADVDGNGTLTEYGYNPAGLLATQRTYASAVDTTRLLTGEGGPALATTLASLRPVPGEADARQWRAYDAAGRLLRQAVATASGNEVAITSMEYDAASRLVRTVAHANLVAAAAVTDTSIPTPAPSGDDRVTRYFHDADGRPTGVLDAEGYLSTTVYNAAGLAVEQLAFAQAVRAELRAAGTLAELMVGLPSDADASVLFFHDARGRVIAQVDAEDYLTRMVYDAAGNVRQTVRYASRVAASVSATTAVQDILVPANAATDRITDRSYDALGRLVAQTSPEGVKTTFAYDSAGHLVATESAVDTSERRSMLARYDVLGRVTGELTGEGAALVGTAADAQALDAIWANHATTHAYDAAGRRISSTDPLGNKTLYFYDQDGALTHTVDALGGVQERVYDAQGRLLKEIGYARRISTIGLAGGLARADLASRLTTIADAARDIRTDYTYTAAGAQAFRKSVLGAETGFTYNAFGERIATTPAGSPAEKATFDRRGLQVRTEITASGLNLVSSVVYDAFGRAVRTVDANGNVRNQAFDRSGRQVSTRDATGGLRSTTYDAFDRVLTETDARGNRTSYSYDAQARSVTVTSAVGTKTVSVVNVHGELQSATDANGYVTTYSHDRDGNVLTRTVDPAGLKLRTTYSYDEAGRALTVLSPDDTVTEYVYDALGRRTSESVDPNGLNLRSSWTYDANGNVVTSTNAGGGVTRYAYDADGRLVYTVGPAGDVHLDSYDAAGRVVVTTAYAKPIDDAAALGSAFSEADVRSRVSADATRDRVEHRVFDAAGRIVATVDALGAVVGYTFDAKGNVIARRAYANVIAPKAPRTSEGLAAALVPDNANDRITRYAYDAADRQVLAIDATGAMTKTQYDAAGNVVAVTAYADPASTSAIPPNPSLAALEALVTPDPTLDRTTRYAYDAADRRIYEVDPLGAVTASQYDGAGQVLVRTRYALAISASAASVSAIADAIEASAGDRKQAFSYDAAGRLVGTTDALGGKQAFTLDRMGRKVVFINQQGATWTYAYDAAGRLVTETSPKVDISSVAYDSETKVLKLESTQNKAIVTRMAYDALGNLTQRTEAAGRDEERITRYEYDAAGRQVRVVFPKVGVYNPKEDDLTGNGDTGVAKRTEDELQLETRTIYDVLGNAVTGVDVGGGTSTKTYDAQGRVASEVDAMGYVTRYTRNAFGEVVQLRRVAVTTKNDVADRILTSTYDRAGRLVETREPAAYVYQHVVDGSGRAQTAARWTRNAYNAFGELVQVIAPRGVGDATATTTHYYDRAGRQFATVDALGYLTRRTFDTVGNVLSSTEYANTVETWTVVGYGKRPDASADDRRTEYVYDRLNRKTAEIRKDVEFSAKSDGKSAVGDLITGYAYDAVGNQTAVKDAAGGMTYTYYDALGRIQAIAAPTRAGADGKAIVPLTTFRRDAHGKVVVTIEYAEGASSASSAGYEASSDKGDRMTFAAYDSLGRNVRGTDAEGHTQYFSYDRFGKLAKQWQAVEGDGRTRTVFQVNVYDKLGRLVQTITPDSRWVYADGKVKTVDQGDAGLVKVTMVYNAFGEVIAKGLGTGTEEEFHYDAAGRLWRTNSGDGVWRVNLYDLQGNVTSEIRSSGSGGANEDLTDVTSAAQAAALRSTRRTDMVYDALGRVTARENAARIEKQGGLTVDRQHVSVETLKSARPDSGAPLMNMKWIDKNKVVLEWDSLAALGSGDIKVTVEYLTPEKEYILDDTPGAPIRQTKTLGGEPRKFTSEAITSYAGANGATLEWEETASKVGDGGIDEITRIVVYKKDVDGIWRAVVDQTPGYGGNVVDFAAPPNPDTSIVLQLRQAGTKGTDGWFSVSTYDFGNSRRFDADPLGPGKYEYRVQVKTPGEDWHITSSGDISLTSPPLNAISAGLAHGKAGSGMFSWKAPASGYGQDFRYRTEGSTGIWRSLEIETNKAGLQVVDTRVLDDGDYDFELLWSRTDHGVAVSHAVGTFTVGKKHSGSIDSTPGKVAISTSEGGKIAQDKDTNGESRWLRPLVLQTFDRWGNVLSVTDPRSAKWKTTYEYNAGNQVVARVEPNAATTRYYYDELGRQVAVRDANQHVNRQEWDAGGNLVTEAHADDGVILHRYDAFGNRTSTRHAEGNTVMYGYDRMGRMTSMNKGSANDYSVSTNNETLKKVNRDIVESWTYDELGQKTTHTNGNKETITYSYDLRGNLVQTTLPLKQATRSAYDALGRKLAEVDAEGNFRTWTYDYFGVLKVHKDLDGAVFKYSHDEAGQLVKRSTTDRRQVIEYEYDAAGQLTRIEDSDNDKVTTYGYDLAGRRVRERVVQNDVTYQDNHLSYDAAGRLRDVADGRVHIQMDYDAVGNRTRIRTRVNYQGVTKEVTDSSDRYFLYDEMNRQTVVDGIDENGTIGADQGHKIYYDRNGNRTKDVAWRNRIATTEDVIKGYDDDGTVVYTGEKTSFKQSIGKSTETYLYDNLDRLVSVTRDGVQVDVRRYDGADRVIRSGPFAVLPGYMALLNEGRDPGDEHSEDVRINRYDANGRLMHQRIKSSDGKTLKTDISWDPTEQSSKFEYHVANGYDDAGNVRSYVVWNYEGAGATEYKTGLVKFDSYQTLTTSAKSTVREDGLVTHAYDANGFLTSVKDAKQNDNNRVLINDSEGRVLATKQEGHIRRQLIANGEVLGSYGVGVDPLDPSSGKSNKPNFANFANFNFGYAPITGGYPSAAPGAYQVKSGDTLQVIAQTAYGESGLWYRIAEANGLSSNNDLRVGQTITIPNRVGTVGNNSGTFKPYDPTAMVGDTTPSMPLPSGGGGAGCGGMGQLLMVVVAVAATVLTAGVLAPLMCTAGAPTLAGIMTAGMAALGTGTLGVAGAAVAAAVGSVAGQLVGKATGNVKKFSWTQVGLSAISAGLTQGIGPQDFNLSQAGNVAVRSAVSNIATQGIGVATGLQRSFNWKGVAASAMGAGIGEAVGQELGGFFEPSPLGQFATRFGAGLAGGATAAVLRGGKVAVQQVATDAFGNALGYSLADAATASPSAPFAGTMSEEDWQHLGQKLGLRGNAQDAGVLVADAGPGKETLGLGFKGRTAIIGAPTTTQEILEKALVEAMVLKGQYVAAASAQAALARGLSNIEQMADVYRASGMTGATGDPVHFDFSTPAIAPVGGTLGGDGGGARWIPSADGLGGTVLGRHMTPEEILAFDAAQDSPVSQIYNDMNERLSGMVNNAQDQYVQNGAQSSGWRYGLNAAGYIASEFFPKNVGQAAFEAVGGPLVGRAVGAGVAQLNKLPILGSTLPQLGHSLSGWFGRGAVPPSVSAPSPLSQFRAVDTSNMTRAGKGVLAENRGAFTYQRAGYQEMPARLSSNNGFDGVFVKRQPDGSVRDIIINESKFSSTGRASLPNTNMGKQMSPSWINENMQKMMNSADPAVMETGFFLDANRAMIRTKGNVLDPLGNNRWNVLQLPR